MKGYSESKKIKLYTIFRHDERSIDQEVLGIRSHATSRDEEEKKEKEKKEKERKEKEGEFLKEVVQYMGDITNQQFSEKATKLIENRIQKAIDFLDKLREVSSTQESFVKIVSR